MVKQKSLADMDATNTRLSTDLEEYQRVCQEQSENISIMQENFAEKEEELGKTKSEDQKQVCQLLNSSCAHMHIIIIAHIPCICMCMHTLKCSYVNNSLPLQRIEKIKAERVNELANLKKELLSIQQKCSLLKKNSESHEAESKRLKRELEMTHSCERKEVDYYCTNISKIIPNYNMCSYL